MQLIERNKLMKAYDPENFREQGYKIIDMLANYLDKAGSGNLNSALPAITPEDMDKKWSSDFPELGQNNTENMLEDVINMSNHLQNPKYLGHQVTSPLPESVLYEAVGSFLNNASAIYEMGPVNTILEKKLISWMAGLVGYDNNAGGIFTSGGTLGNLTALLAARQAKAGYDIWSEGINSDLNLAIMVSDQAHYSSKRAAQIMGIGEKGVITIPTDSEYKLDMNELRAAYKKAVDSGRKVFAIVGSACSTATGIYDDLDKLADFAEENDIWFHVDGAHGASALLSSKYKNLLKGVERADSVIWDAHKMMLMPALITAVIFKNNANSYEAFSQKASYLFEKDASEEWYNLAHRTMECTKNMMGLRLYTSLMNNGTKFFADYVTDMYDLTRDFAKLIKESIDFQLAIEPESNIICFRFIPEKFESAEELDNLQKSIRKTIIERENFYIVQTSLKNGAFLRCTIINPLTKLDDIKNLLAEIREVSTLN